MANKPHDADDLPWVILGMVFGGLLLLFLLGACAVAPIRLNPGECVVLVESQQVIVAGNECNVQRLNK